MVYVGDRFKFKPYGDGYFRAQIVSVTRVSANSDFWCLFKKTNASESELLCQSQEVPGHGMLEPVDAPRGKQHDELTLEDWRHKIRSMR